MEAHGTDDDNVFARCLQFQPRTAKKGGDDDEIDTSRFVPVIAHSLHLDVPEESPESVADLQQPISNRFPVALATSPGIVDILVPEDLIPAQPPAKRRKRKGVSRKVKPVLASLSLTVKQEEDLAIFLKAQRINAPVVQCEGPTLSLTLNNNTWSLDLEFSASLVKNTDVMFPSRFGPTAANTAFTLFGRLLDNYALEDPENVPPVAMARLFDILTSNATLKGPEKLHPKGMRTPLLQFQKDSVRWCIRKEGKDLDPETGALTALDPQVRDHVVTPPLGWSEVYRENDKPLWVNPFLNVVSDAPPDPEPLMQDGEYCGQGLLAEEMGLGKTVEMIALMLLNPRPPIDSKTALCIDPITGMGVRKIKATLVLMPQVILSQWHNELTSHAPDLKVLVFRKPYVGQKEEKVTAADLAASDVVLVSYERMTSELHGALFDPSARNTRFWRERTDIEKLRSPLVQVQFWRVLLDEVQMMNTGLSNAARVARIIPRIHAWGVSGTPVRSNMSDIRGIIFFLKLSPYMEKPSWSRMLSSPPHFEQLISMIGIRHSKPMVSSQLSLPRQKRQMVVVEFSEVERHTYDELLRSFKASEKTESELSYWLVRLRQACSYPAVGAVNTVRLFDLSQPALAIDEVLARLVDDAETELESHQRAEIAGRLELGQYLDKADKLAEAIELWKSVVEQEEAMSSNLKAKLKDREKDLKGKEKIFTASEAALKEARAKLRQITEMRKDIKDQDKKINVFEDSKDYRAAEDMINAASRSEEDAKARVTKLRAEHEDAKLIFNHVQGRVRGLRARLRGLQELLHRSYFFLGTSYFRLTERTNPDEAERTANEVEEKRYYDLAEEVRSDLLPDPREIEATAKKVYKPGLTLIEMRHPPPIVPFLNRQAEWLLDIRRELLELLRTPLFEQHEEGEPEAYTESLDAQENAHVLLDLLTQLLADRTAFVNDDSWPREIREGPDPWSKLKEKVMDRRNDELPHHAVVKGFSADVTNDSPVLKTLRSELGSWRKMRGTLSDIYNSRVDYYKQLQSFSDRVVDPDVDPGRANEYVEQKRAAVREEERKVALFAGKLRYLENVVLKGPLSRETNSDGDNSGVKIDEDDVCTICQDSFKFGTITICGHRFCASCIEQWYAQSQTCPLCKRSLSTKDMFQFNTEAKGGGKSGGDWNELEPIRRISSELYHQIPNHFYNELIMEAVKRNYGAKIDMIVRLAKNLRETDSRAQIVIFSQWTTMLRALERALQENGLNALTLSGSGVASFCRDSQFACFLLNANTEAAGLTLVNATHVFLCEPLLNTALEVQAISRVHRIGQTRETNVWLFGVDRTVEQAILAIATEKRIRQIAETRSEDLWREQSDELNTDAADSAILATSGTQFFDRLAGSEAVPVSELRQVLFWKPPKDEPSPSEENYPEPADIITDV